MGNMTCAETVRNAADLRSDETALLLGYYLDLADSLDWTCSLPGRVPCQTVDHPFAVVYCKVP